MLFGLKLIKKSPCILQISARLVDDFHDGELDVDTK